LLSVAINALLCLCELSIGCAPYSTLMPARLTASAHSAISALRNGGPSLPRFDVGMGRRRAAIGHVGEVDDAFINHLARFSTGTKPVGKRYFVARLSGKSAPRPFAGDGRRRSQMQVAISHDAIQTGHRADVDDELSAAKQPRVSTTATLVAVTLCALVAQGHLLAARTPSRVAAAAPDSGTPPVTIIAPEFCKNQTWPYIDSRCLRRVDPPLPADDHKPIAPVTAAAAPPAAGGVSANTVAAAPTNAQTAAATPPPAAAAPASSPLDPRAQVIQSVFPAAPPSAVPDDGANAAPDTFRRTSDVPQHRRSRHWNNHSGLFGFRF
jgi:hypothetical protein